jgi:hypothetical protein
MFALLLCSMYEGSQLLGVYSSLDRAVEAAGAYEKDFSQDWLEVEEIDGDAPAAERHTRRVVWSS